MADICSLCRKKVTGGFDVWSKPMKDGGTFIAVDSTPDRNFNICDLCNIVICFDCSVDPDTGYCNDCLRRITDDGEQHE